MSKSQSSIKMANSFLPKTIQNYDSFLENLNQSIKNSDFLEQKLKIPKANLPTKDRHKLKKSIEQVTLLSNVFNKKNREVQENYGQT
jgi:hypothetical protein